MVYRALTEKSPTNVLDEEWDDLLIFDGCPHDTFAEYNSLDGDLQSRISLGSQRWEFFRRNFAGVSVHDTVYVTANTFTSRFDDGVKYAVVNLPDEWNDRL